MVHRTFTILAAVALLGIGMLAGPARAGERGTLSGVLEVTGGKPGVNGCGCVRERGIVVVTGIHGAKRRIKTDRTGHFSVRLAAGRYHAVGGIPALGWKLGRCTVDRPLPPAWVHVSPGRRTRITVDCHGK